MIEKDYRDLLRQFHEDRKKENPLYSLRAFARDLSLTPSQLSLVLNRKKGLSAERAKRAFHKVFTDPHVIERCLLQVQAEHSRDQGQKALAHQKLNQPSRHYESFTLSKKAFDIIGNWHHIAILQALALKSAPKTEKDQLVWLAKRLNLPLSEVAAAVERMASLELVELKGKKIVVRHESVLSPNGVPSTALRNFHRQVIQKAVISIETQKINERFLNSIMIPIQKSALPKMQEDILKFQRAMMKKYGRVKEADGDAVYALSLQCFRLCEDDQ